MAAAKPSPAEIFYGLGESPFALSTDPRFFFHSTPHDAVSQQLLTAIRDRAGLVLLTGHLGTGKTTLCRVVMEEIDRRTLTSLVSDPSVSGEELLRKVLADFGVARDEGPRGTATSRDLLLALRSFVESLASLDARAVVIVDEAQSLPADALDQVRTLCEAAETSSQLQVVLVGQPSFAALLRRPENRALQQRIAVRASLDPLPAGEVGEYVQHRFAIAGSSRLPFTEAALAQIHRLSRGVPRVINLVCDRALARGAAAPVTEIDAAIVDAAAEDLDLAGPRSRLGTIGARALTVLWLVLCLLAGAGLAGWIFRDALGRAVTRWKQSPPISQSSAARTTGLATHDSTKDSRLD